MSCGVDESSSTVQLLPLNRAMAELIWWGVLERRQRRSLNKIRVVRRHRGLLHELWSPRHRCKVDFWTREWPDLRSKVAPEMNQLENCRSWWDFTSIFRYKVGCCEWTVGYRDMPELNWTESASLSPFQCLMVVTSCSGRHINTIPFYDSGPTWTTAIWSDAPHCPREVM